MSPRTLFAFPCRSAPILPSCPRRTFTVPTVKRSAPAPDREDAHGSVSASRKLRPRDRLQFTEASERELAREAGVAGATPLSSHAVDSINSAETVPSTSAITPSTPSPPSPVPVQPEPIAPSTLPPDSASDDAGVVVSPPESGLPHLHSHVLPVPRIPFSTHRFVRKLEQASVPRGMAEDLMQATKSLLIREEERARQELLNKQDLENEAYLFAAALNELKTGSQVKSRNDSITLKSLTASLQREVDALEQKMKEDMQRLSSDIQLEANSRKEETGQELQNLDKKVMDLNSRFTILLSEVRTEIEATKWISTRRVMTAIVVVVVVVVATFSSRSVSKKSKSSTEQPLPTIEELGVQVQPGGGEEAEVLPDGTPANKGWAYWTGQAGATAGQKMGVAKGKRVGEEGE